LNQRALFLHSRAAGLADTFNAARIGLTGLDECSCGLYNDRGEGFMACDAASLLGVWKMKVSPFYLYCLVFFLVIGSGCAPIRPVPVKPFADGKDWVVLDEVRYRIGNTNDIIVVPAGFVTDFASVPRSFWAVYSPFGQYQWAAVVHDYLYWTQQCSREQADRLMRLAMDESGVTPWTREAIYRSVRLGGQSAWDDNAAAKASGVVRFVPLKETANGPQLPLPVGENDDWATYRAKLKDLGPAVPPPGQTPSVSPPGYCTAVDAEIKARKLWP
jgi:hypothetical protein